MSGPVNIWAAGTDSLLQTLAQRDAKARLDEQKQRQLQLDEEERQDRMRMRNYQDAQLRDLHESRVEAAADRQAGIDAKAADSAAKGLKHFELQGLVEQYTHEKDPERKARLKERLMFEHEIKFPEPKSQSVTYRDIKGPKGESIQRAFPTTVGAGDELPPDVESWHPPRGGTGDEPKPATPAQIRAATSAAERQATQEFSDIKTRPTGVTREMRVKEIRDQALSDLGVDPEKYPLKSVIREVTPKPIIPAGSKDAKPVMGPGYVMDATTGQAVPQPITPTSPTSVKPPVKPPPAAGGMVSMRAPDGRLLSVPAADVQKMLDLKATLVK